jgi:hypothetical protein
MPQDSNPKTRLIDRLPYKTIAAVVVTGVVCTASTATAATLITSAQIKDQTILNRDIHPGTISESRLGEALRAKLNRMTAQSGKDGVSVSGKDGVNGHGAKGDRGANGNDGAKGDRGDKGDRGSDGRDGTQLPAGFFVTNSSVESALDGVVFGPYANGGAQGGSLVNTKVAGMKVSDIGHLAYTAKWSNDEGTDVGVPYLRLFLENGSRMIFSPNTQPAKDTAPGVFHKWTVHTGTVRYDDDKGNGADMTWDQFVTAHGTEKLKDLRVSAGYTAGTNLSTTLKSLELNNQTWSFGADQA